MSMPRETSPCASVKTLPCSDVIIAASVSRCVLSRPRKALITRARRSGGVLGPGRERLLRGGDGGVDFGRRGERDLPGDGAGGRVEHRLAAAARAGHACAPPTKWPISAVLVKASLAPMVVSLSRWKVEGVVSATAASARHRHQRRRSDGGAAASFDLRPRARASAGTDCRAGRVVAAGHQQRELGDDRAQRERRRRPARRAAATSPRSRPCRRRGRSAGRRRRASTATLLTTGSSRASAAAPGRSWHRR